MNIQDKNDRGLETAS